MIKWLFNCWAKLHPYRTEWVEDLPDCTSKDTVYVVGGRKYPFQAVLVCPRRACKQLVHLDVSPDIKGYWKLTEHSRGELSLYPSVHVTGLRCKCHYWLMRGRIRWSETPVILVPRENRCEP